MDHIAGIHALINKQRADIARLRHQAKLRGQQVVVLSQDLAIANATITKWESAYKAVAQDLFDAEFSLAAEIGDAQ